MSEEKTSRGRLRHSSDNEPGYSRRRKGRYWAYFDENNERVTDRETIERLNAIGLPPAYEQAWFCKDANGHLQATGVDDRGRKQYRYHTGFRARADKKKFTGLEEFGRSLSKLRRRVDQDLRSRKLARDKVLAAVVRLLDEEYLRIGNDRYAKENKSFGATTLLCRHVKSDRGQVKMRFKGKHGIAQEVTITDRRLGRIVRQCQELPGQTLFQYINGDGTPHAINSADVNDYIRDACGADFTAKHFRTWGASVIAFEEMLEAADEARKISVKTMVEPVAEALGNTVAISRKSYVHPKLVEAVKDDPRNPLGEVELPRARKWMSPSEIALLDFLSRRKRAKARTSPSG